MIVFFQCIEQFIMFLYVFLIALLNCCVTCDDCVTYNFENDYEDLFRNDFGVCIPMPMTWSLGTYSSISVENPNSDSNNFIRPASSMSCVTSFTFPMTFGGIIEVNFYIQPAVMSDTLTILVNIATSGNHPTINTYVMTPALPNFLPGWHVARIQLTSAGSFTGYVSIPCLLTQLLQNNHSPFKRHLYKHI